MRFITRLLGLERLYSRKVGLAYSVDALFMVFACTFVWLAMYELFLENQVMKYVVAVSALLLVVLYFAYYISIYLAIKSIINKRNYIMKPKTHQSIFIQSSTNDLMNVKDQTDLIEVRANYSLYDVRFDVYRKGRHGEYKSREEFHTVIEYTLRRELPQLIFDSKRAKGRQFIGMFMNGQKLSLEGNFDDYFDLYSPMFYQIDTLSFITPEVMEQFIALSEYDFEIKANRLLILAPLLPDSELDEFKKRTLVLFTELNQNLRAYRDSRIKNGKQNVTQFGRSLLVSPRRKLISLAVSVIFYGGLYLSALSGSFSEEILFYMIITFIPICVQGYGLFKILKSNREKIQSFKNAQV